MFMNFTFKIPAFKSIVFHNSAFKIFELDSLTFKSWVLSIFEIDGVDAGGAGGVEWRGNAVLDYADAGLKLWGDEPIQLRWSVL